MLKRLLLAVLFALAASAANAQTLAYTQSAVTVTTGGTFQTVVAAGINRKFCIIQNNSTHVMYVYLGTLGSATLLNSIQVTAGNSFSCAHASGYVMTLPINVTTSTTADPLVVSYVQ